MNYDTIRMSGSIRLSSKSSVSFKEDRVSQRSSKMRLRMVVSKMPKSLEQRYRFKMGKKVKAKKKRNNLASSTPHDDGLRLIGRHAYAAK